MLRVLAAPSREATLIEVAGANGESRDLIAWSASPAGFELGPVRCRCRAAWLRERADGRAASLVAFGASEAVSTVTGAPVPLTRGLEGCAVAELGR